MLELLPKMYLHGNRPSFYDSDSVTVLELSASMHGKMNELIDDYNKFVDNVNAQITEFMNSTNQNYEVFQTAMRQEFQDFIDIINLKYEAQDQRVDAKIRECEAAVDALIAQISTAETEVLNAEY
jgi:wobble nucleotide-excising tRNase